MKLLCNTSITKRFWKYTNVRDREHCWNWTGYIQPNGYGEVSVHSKQMGAHRLSWIIHYGKIPDSFCVCHKCDNPSCVNPNHLFIGTYKDNVHDMMNKNRYSCARGEKVGGAKLTESQVREIRTRHNCSANKLAKEYGVCKSNIGAIRNYKSWRWLK